MMQQSPKESPGDSAAEESLPRCPDESADEGSTASRSEKESGNEESGSSRATAGRLEIALREKAAELARAEQESQELRQALQKQVLVLARHRRKVEEEKARMERLLKRYRREAQIYRGHLHDVYASRSWKLSAPIRRAIALMRGARSVTAGEELVLSAMAGERRRPDVKTEVAMDPVLSARRQADFEVRQIKSRMLKLGFLERGLAELEARVLQQEDPFLRQTAAWELAVWRANRYTQEDARKCLAYLDVVEPATEDPDMQRRASVLRAESLALLGDEADAAAVLRRAIELDRHPDLFLGVCSLSNDETERLSLINEALAVTGLAPVELSTAQASTPYDRLHGSAEALVEVGGAEGDTKVTIIVPAYNAQDTIGTTLRALSVQTWRNLEIIVSDDCSTDRTCDIVEQWIAQDSRISLIRGEANSGPYVVRNRALRVATGRFVTCNDSDDWSHPQKIEIQALHLLENPSVIANTSEQARVSEDLEFYRRGNPGFYVQPNMSSLMFRRVEVVSRIGYWDSVRFAADSEYTRRIKKAFGRNSIADVPSGPLSFQRQTAGSLTGSESFGYHGFKMGARREYEMGHKRFHASATIPYMPFPLPSRPFVVPEPMRPDRQRSQEGARDFDVILVSDFRMPGGTSMSNIEEIKAQRKLGLRTGLVQMSLYHMNADREFNRGISSLIDGENVDLIVYGEQARCDLLIVRLPWVLEDWQEYIPKVDAKNIVVIVNQPPKRDYAPDSPHIYHLQQCRENLVKYFGSAGTWYPIGPLVREALDTHHRDELVGIDLSQDDWPNIIDVEEWRRPARPPRRQRIRICRHSRDQYVKWPESREQLLQVYPDSEKFEVHILGGAKSAAKVLGGKLPKRWHVLEFGEMKPAKFLKRQDVFVYYTHPDWVESFGRVIFEAMAVGVPVFLPPIYSPLFGDAAIYSDPSDVIARVEALMADDAAYEEQVQRAWSYVERAFGHAQHESRIGNFLDPARSEAVSPA